jgi:hypothetical protein
MSDLFASIRNQDEYAMTSVEGVAFVAILQQDGTILKQTAVDLFFANAQFENIPPGNYTVVAFHQSVNPLEPERQLLRINARNSQLCRNF